MKFILVLASFYCASAFGLHAATSSVKTLGYGVANSNKLSVRPVDVFGVANASARGSLVRCESANINFPYHIVFRTPCYLRRFRFNHGLMSGVLALVLYYFKSFQKIRECRSHSWLLIVFIFPLCGILAIISMVF
jgi:hypothetical protein